MLKFSGRRRCREVTNALFQLPVRPTNSPFQPRIDVWMGCLCVQQAHIAVSFSKSQHAEIGRLNAGVCCAWTTPSDCMVCQRSPANELLIENVGGLLESCSCAVSRALTCSREGADGRGAVRWFLRKHCCVCRAGACDFCPCLQKHGWFSCFTASPGPQILVLKSMDAMFEDLFSACKLACCWLNGSHRYKQCMAAAGGGGAPAGLSAAHRGSAELSRHLPSKATFASHCSLAQSRNTNRKRDTKHLISTGTGLASAQCSSFSCFPS